jgi:hypothetical protein
MMTAYSREASGTPALSRKLPSRIGTAPLSPAHRTNSRSPRASRTGNSTRLAVEPLDLSLVGGAGVAGQDAGDEHGQEPRAVGDGRRPVK